MFPLRTLRESGKNGSSYHCEYNLGNKDQVVCNVNCLHEKRLHLIFMYANRYKRKVHLPGQALTCQVVAQRARGAPGAQTAEGSAADAGSAGALRSAEPPASSRRPSTPPDGSTPTLKQ